MSSLQPSHAPQVTHPGSEAGNRLSLAVAKLDTLIHRVRHLGGVCDPVSPQLPTSSIALGGSEFGVPQPRKLTITVL